MRKTMIDESLAIEIAENVFGQKPEKIERAGVGIANYVYLIECRGTRYVLRLNNEGNDYSETARLLASAEKAGMPVSHVEASGFYKGANYIALTYISGQDLGIVYNKLSPQDKRNIARETVKLQKCAASIQCAEKPRVWYNFIFEMLDQAEERIKSGGYFNNEKAAQLKTEAQKLMQYFSALKPVPYLDDISTKNLLIDGGHVSGVIDIDEIGYGDALTYIALMRVALLNMGYDDDICNFILDEMNADNPQRRAEVFYCLLYCTDFMGERGMTFNGKKVEVNPNVVSRLNSLYGSFWQKWQNIQNLIDNSNGER